MTRRALLAGLALAGCAPLTHGDLPRTGGVPVVAPNRLRIVIFEMAGPDVPFHTGLIVHAEGQALLYDPAGRWHPEGQCRPEGEVIPGLMAPQVFRLQEATGWPDPALLGAVAATLAVGLWRRNAIWAMLAGGLVLAALTALI